MTPLSLALEEAHQHQQLKTLLRQAAEQEGYATLEHQALGIKTPTNFLDLIETRHRLARLMGKNKMQKSENTCCGKK